MIACERRSCEFLVLIYPPYSQLSTINSVSASSDLSRLPEPGIVAGATVYSLLLLRRFYLRHLALPRFSELRRHGDPDPKTGRIHMRITYGNYPFYVKPTLWNRWGPKAWAIWLYGGKVPGDNAEEYMPQGFLWTDMGPRNRIGLGTKEMEADAQRMRTTGRGGCPF